MSVKGNMGKDG